jgi:hypothetical protein
VNHPPRYRVLARPRSPEEALAPQPFPPRGACVTVSSQGEHSEGPVIAQGHREHPPEYPAEPPGLRWARVISGGAGGNTTGGAAGGSSGSRGHQFALAELLGQVGRLQVPSNPWVTGRSAHGQHSRSRLTLLVMLLLDVREGCLSWGGPPFHCRESVPRPLEKPTETAGGSERACLHEPYLCG